MAEGGRTRVTIEEYVERRLESGGERLVERHYRRARWEPTDTQPALAHQVVSTAGPILRAVAIALAPALGRLAVRALAPHLRAALPPPTPVRALRPNATGVTTPTSGGTLRVVPQLLPSAARRDDESR